MGRRSIIRRWIAPGLLGLLGGCATTGQDELPPAAALPIQPIGAVSPAVRPVPPDDNASQLEITNEAGEIRLVAASQDLPPPEKAPPKQPGERKRFELPLDLPGAEAPPIAVPDLRGLSGAEREKKVNELYPPLSNLPENPKTVMPEGGKPFTLHELQAIAMEKSPVVRRASADVDVAYGLMVQAGLYPNPHTGYQADQWQPGPLPKNNSGQQGAFIQQLFKTAGKLPLARAAAAMDYSNAGVALRRAQIDVISQVRANYFAVIVAYETMRVNRVLSELADEVYRLQTKLVASGEAAGYEPLQLYAQAVQARAQYARAHYGYLAAWRQLAASMGTPNLPLSAVDGKADAPIPQFDDAEAQAWMLERHTDILTGKNTILRSQHLLRLARVTPIPDINVGTALQHDNSVGNNQFNLQIGIAIPVFDRNQGNIRAARAMLSRSVEDLRARQNNLLGMLAEAFGRYRTNQYLMLNFRQRVLPNLTRAYRAIIQRHQVEPDKVQFTDIVFAQQNLATALTSYLAAMGDQWNAVVDMAALLQLDDLYQSISPPPPQLPAPQTPTPQLPAPQPPAQPKKP